MCRTKSCVPLLAAVLLLHPLPQAARADGTNAPAIPWSVEVKTELPNLIEPFHRAYITAGTNKFALLLPQGYRFQDNAERRLKIGPTNGSSQIVFSILGPMPPDAKELKADDVRELVAKIQPNGKILQEFQRTAAGRNGPGFDLQWKTAAGKPLCMRVVFIPSDAGILEFTATTSLEDFPSMQDRLERLLQSFVASKDGKLEVIHLSDRI